MAATHCMSFNFHTITLRYDWHMKALFLVESPNVHRWSEIEARRQEVIRQRVDWRVRI